jgi:iron complex outermembrane recepter protein
MNAAQAPHDKTISSWPLLGLTLLAATVSPICAAQDTAADSGDNSGKLTEITVTAQKRGENLQTVPLSVSAVTAEMIEASHFQSTRDLQFMAPSLVYNELSGFAQPYLRGIGNDTGSPNVDPSVATYIDGVYIADSQSAVQSLLGVERIEVVAGPQGTLYGRNVLGGAINIETLTPTHETNAQVAVTGGNLSSKEVVARISGGVNDKLAVGLYGLYTERDSIYDRPEIPGQADKTTRAGARLKGVLNVNDDVTLTGSLTYSKTRTADDAFRQGAANAVGFADPSVEPLFGPYILRNDAPFRNFNEQYDGTLRANIDLGPVSLVSISNYHRTSLFTSNDTDATPAALFSSLAFGKSRQLSQELQLLSNRNDGIEYIAGLYYFNQEAGQIPNINGSPAFFLPATQQVISTLIKTDAYAGFGQATITPIEHLRLTLGARYTYDPYYTSVQGPPIGSITTYPDAEESWTKFTPHVSVNYQSGNTLLYATYSQGFQSGAYNTNSLADPPVNPATLSSFEIGTKSDLLEDRLRFNTAAYYYDFKDLQVQILTAGSSSGLSVFKNAATAEAYGLEAYLQAVVTSEFTLTGQVAWEHARYTDFRDFPAVIPATVGFAGISLDASGNDMPRAPDWSGTLAADYTKRLASGSEFGFNLNVYHNSGFSWDASNLYQQPAYTVLNSSISYTMPGGQWTLTAWGRNLTDEHYEDQRLTIAFGALVTDADPRTYGLTATFKY